MPAENVYRYAKKAFAVNLNPAQSLDGFDLEPFNLMVTFPLIMLG